MTGRDCYEAVLRGEHPEFLPRVPILMQFAAEHIGSDYAAFAADHRVLVEANLRCAETFGMDQLSAISDPYRETAGFGADLEFVPDGPPICLAPPLAGDRDLARLPGPDPETAPRMRDRLDAVRAMSAAAAATHSILGWVEGPAAEAADLRGVTEFLVDLMDDPAFARELMDRCVTAGIAFAEAQARAGADTIGIGDAICSQLSPGLYEELVLPRQRRLVDAIHTAGARVRLHICGDITHLLPGIRGLDLDILDVDHMVDMRAVRDAVGREVALAGNIDPVAGVRFGTPESIRTAVRATYAAVGDPYLVNAGCEIPSGTPDANLLALCDPIAPSA